MNPTPRTLLLTGPRTHRVYAVTVRPSAYGPGLVPVAYQLDGAPVSHEAFLAAENLDATGATRLLNRTEFQVALELILTCTHESPSSCPCTIRFGHASAAVPDAISSELLRARFTPTATL